VITALFADLAGSTQLGESLHPEDFRDLTGGALAQMGAAIEELGGTIRGTAGDGVLGLFGAPTAHEDDAERAVVAGLRLVDRMREYGREAAERWGVTNLRVRVGIETGLAVLGEVRAGSQAQYDASGDCLNTAARLEGAADPGGVLVGPVTHRLVSDAFDWGDVRPLVLKGKADPVPARHALASRGDRPQTRHPSGSGSRLVGRDHELARADEIVTEVRDKHLRVVFVTGQAGIGKTRFMREFRSLFETPGLGSPSSTWLEGTCLSYAADEPYLPFRQVLRQALGTGLEGIDPMLRMILGLPPQEADASRIAALSAESLQQAVVDALTELVVDLAARGPVAIALDDLHWADAASVRLAEGLLSRLPDDVPVLLILAMRPERERAAWALRERVLERQPNRSRELSLTSLDREAERGLVTDLVGEGTLPEGLESVLLRRAEGNPFFLRELLRSLRDNGAIVQSQGRWSFDPQVTVEVPDTVERVVLARIDRLSPGDRDLLDSAAVIGREFELPLLARIAGLDLSADSLSNLTRLGLFEQAAAGGEYRFSHPLIQETAYLSMLRRGRAELHGRAAAAIEELIEDGSDAHHAVLARHHSAAGHLSEAVKYHRLAALASQRVVAMAEAMNQFDLAVAAAGSLDQESARTQLPELYLLRGHARGRTGDWAGGKDDLGRAVEGARAIGDLQVEMQALNDFGWLIRADSYEQSIDCHLQALRIAEELGDASAQVSALSFLSMIHLNRLRLDEGMDLAQRALQIARATGRDQLLGTALDCLKLAALQLGHLDLLERTVAEIIEVQERADDLYLLQWAYIEGATTPLARGEIAKARERIDAAAEINARFVSERIARAMLLEASSWIDRAEGDPPAAIAALRQAEDALGSGSSPEFAAWLQASLGSHLIEQGELAEAIAVLESALRHAQAVNSPNRALRSASHLAWARWLVGDADGAREALDQAEAVLATITAPPGSVFLDGYRSYLAIARTQLALGATSRAQELLAPLVSAAREFGWRDAEQEADQLLATVTGSGVPAPPDQAP